MKARTDIIKLALELSADIEIWADSENSYTIQVTAPRGRNMTHYYKVFNENKLLRFLSIHSNWDIVDPTEISRTQTVKLKGGYCVEFYLKNIPEPQFRIPNLGGSHEGLHEAQRIIDIVAESINMTK